MWPPMPRSCASWPRISTSKPADVRSVLDEVADRFRDVTVVAGREAERRSELATAAPITAVVPTMPTDVHDLAGLLAMGGHLLGNGSR